MYGLSHSLFTCDQAKIFSRKKIKINLEYNENRIIFVFLKQTHMEFKILTSTHPEGLTSKVKELIQQGWKPLGGHSVVETHRQNRYSGSQHMDTRIEVEYTISMVKETLNKNVIEVDVAFYHPDDNESVMVYDEEGMREEFEYKLQTIINN